MSATFKDTPPYINAVIKKNGVIVDDSSLTLKSEYGDLVLPISLDHERLTDKRLYSFTLQHSSEGKGFKGMFLEKNRGKLAHVETLSKNNRTLGSLFDHLDPTTPKESFDGSSTLNDTYKVIVNVKTSKETKPSMDQMQAQIYGKFTQEMRSVSQRFAMFMINQAQDDLVILDTQ